MFCELWLRFTMGHLGSRAIASEILERVNKGDQTALLVDLPGETVGVCARRNSRVCQDSKTNRAFFIVLHGLEEHALQPDSFRRCDMDDTLWLIATFRHLQFFQVVYWDEPRVQGQLTKPGEHAECSGRELGKSETFQREVGPTHIQTAVPEEPFDFTT